MFLRNANRFFQSNRAFSDNLLEQQMFVAFIIDHRDPTHPFFFLRHTLTPTFSTSKLKEMLGIVVQCSDHMVDNLLKKVTEDNGLFDTKE